MNKAKDLENIKKITSITVKSICTRLRINEKNLYNLKTSEKNVRLVKNELIKELKDEIRKAEDN